jgi:hypothetical protein
MCSGRAGSSCSTYGTVFPFKGVLSGRINTVISYIDCYVHKKENNIINIQMKKKDI